MKIKITKDIVGMIQKAYDEQRRIVTVLEPAKNNPSVSKNYQMALGRVEALEAVLDLIDGNSTSISIL